MENSKPRLFFFGDSFVQWHTPSPGHWTERFEEEFDIYRLGSSGASNEAIASQIGVLPKYKTGDRIVFILTEPSRLSKWVYGVQHPDWVKTREDIEKGGWANLFNLSYRDEVEEDKLLHSLFKIRVLKDRLIRNEFKDHHHRYLDTPLQYYNLFKTYNVILANYKPVFLTWSEELFNLNVLDGILHLIPRGSYSTVIEEDPNEHELDHHPGKRGGEVWYSRVKDVMDNWQPLELDYFKVGSNYFDPDTSYIKRGNSITPNVT